MRPSVKEYFSKLVLYSNETHIYTDWIFTHLIFYKYDSSPCIYSLGLDIPSVCFRNTDSVTELMLISICSALQQSCIFSVHILFISESKGYGNNSKIRILKKSVTIGICWDAWPLASMFWSKSCKTTCNANFPINSS